MSVEEKIEQDAAAVVAEWSETDLLKAGKIFVVGCSTSEVIGSKIGTAGTEDVAAILYKQLTDLKEQTKMRLAFQCCEHLNRALVIERETMEKYDLVEVSAVPVPEAGGSMASFAFKHLADPVLVESLEQHADAGMDIGETMIGMHLKHVAIPLRFEQKYIGEARLNFAKTRPKLIGGKRAKYDDRHETSSEKAKGC